MGGRIGGFWLAICHRPVRVRAWLFTPMASTLRALCGGRSCGVQCRWKKRVAISISISGNRNRPQLGSPPHGIWCKLHGPSKADPLMNSDFRELLTILNDCQVDYLVVGGYAYIHYAEPQYTKDIDLWIRPTMENALRLRDVVGLERVAREEP